MDSAVGAGVFVVEVECARYFVAFVEAASGIIKDDGVGIGGAVEGVGDANAIGGGEVDDKSGILGGTKGSVAFADVNDSAAERYLVVLDAGG